MSTFDDTNCIESRMKIMFCIQVTKKKKKEWFKVLLPVCLFFLKSLTRALDSCRSTFGTHNTRASVERSR